MNFSVRVLSVVFFILVSSFLFLRPAFAQTPPVNTNPDVPNNLHTWTQNLMIEVASSLSCMITGIDPLDKNHGCLGFDPKTKKIGYVQNGGGAIGTMGSLIAMTFTPPAGSTDFTRYLASNFGIAKKAYADTGAGFQGLSPLLPIWIAFRNITYLLFVLIFIIIGFAIMLRVHIDPRTVMTIENQIPKIIVGLVMVTFSFAIAGFFIDLMYVLIYLVINVFNSIDIPGVKNTIASSSFSDINGRNVLEVANNIPLSNASFLGTPIAGGLIGIITTASAGVKDIIFHIFATDNPIITAASNFPLVGGAFKGLLDAAISLLAFIIIGVAVLFALFKLWFALIQAYIFVILDVVFAPFWVIAGLVPGSQLSFSSWLRELGAELLAFPATIIMFLLTKVLIDGFAAGGMFFPPLIGNPGAPQTMGALTGLGILLMTPTVVNITKGLLKAPKIDISAIGQAVGVGMGYPISTAKGVAGTYAGSREFRVKKFDEDSKAVIYGRTGALRSIMNRFGH